MFSIWSRAEKLLCLCSLGTQAGELYFAFSINQFYEHNIILCFKDYINQINMKCQYIVINIYTIGMKFLMVRTEITITKC